MFEDCGNCFAMEQSDYTSVRRVNKYHIINIIYGDTNESNINLKGFKFGLDDCLTHADYWKVN